MSNSPSYRRVPKRSGTRLLRLGGLGASIAGNMMADGAKRLASGQRPGLQELLLTPSNASKVAEELSKMRGAAMKVGQLLSMDAGEFIPPELSEVLSRLRASAHAMPPHQLKALLTKHWGRNWLDRFESFRVEPIAAASIGQVHRARTKDGRDLAIKIQYPGIRESIDADVDNVSRLITMSGLLPKGVDLAPLFAEAKVQLHQEADYQREGKFLNVFRNLLDGRHEYSLPEFVEDFSTSDILAMTYMDGVPIESAQSASQEIRDRIVTSLMGLFIEELFSFGVVQTDPNFANYLLSADHEKIILLDFGASREVSKERSTGYREMLIAGMTNDWTRIRAIATNLGLISNDLSAEHEALLKDMFSLVYEPYRTDAPFDFGNSSIAQQISEKGIALRQSGFVHVPPPVTVFIHRKIGGIYLLASRLKARVPLAELVRPFCQP